MLQTRAGLAGAYKGIVHFVDLPSGDMSEGLAICGTVKEGNLADGYAYEPLTGATCKRCLIVAEARKKCK